MKEYKQIAKIMKELYDIDCELFKIRGQLKSIWKELSDELSKRVKDEKTKKCMSTSVNSTK